MREKLIKYCNIFIITCSVVSLVACNKEEMPDGYDEKKFPSCGILIDERDGQEYKTVKIGNVCWMAESLNIGIMIDGSKNQTDNDTIEKYCYNNIESNCDTYGGLYQWDELMQYNTQESSEGICPEGWFVPSDEDWKIMEMKLGMNENDANKDNAWRGHGVGNALKTGANTGFNALYAGARTSNGGWINIENSELQFAYFYTSSLAKDSEYRVWRRCLADLYPSVGRFDSFSKYYGLSVRCIKLAE